MAWREKPFQEIPTEVISRMGDVRISKKSVSLTGSQGGSPAVCYREADPAAGAGGEGGGGGGGGDKVPVLFLHGQNFRGQTWEELGSLALVGATGRRAVAVDLPGYGDTPAEALGGAADRGAFLARLAAALGLDGGGGGGERGTLPVIVSPSMSGAFSLPYLLGAPGVAASRARGFVPVAPVMTGSIPRDRYEGCGVPVLVVYGSRDTGLGRQALGDLSHCPDHRVECMPDAGHACYMNDPQRWHKLLYNFLEVVDKAT